MVTPPASYPYHNNLVLLAKAANHPERRGSVPHLSPYPGHANPGSAHVADATLDRSLCQRQAAVTTMLIYDMNRASTTVAFFASDVSVVRRLGGRVARATRR